MRTLLSASKPQLMHGSHPEELMRGCSEQLLPPRLLHMVLFPHADCRTPRRDSLFLAPPDPSRMLMLFFPFPRFWGSNDLAFGYTFNSLCKPLVVSGTSFLVITRDNLIILSDRYASPVPTVSHFCTICLDIPRPIQPTMYVTCGPCQTPLFLIVNGRRLSAYIPICRNLCIPNFHA